MAGRGYAGSVQMVSPSGETTTIPVPGRYRWQGKWKIRDANSYSEEARNQAERRDRAFRRLLSQGWRVASQREMEKTGVAGEEEQKATDVVDGSAKTGQASHGGDHASCEVKDSPNRAKRGNRGGRSGTRQERGIRKAQQSQPKTSLAPVTQKGGGAVFSAQRLSVHPQMQTSAEKSAELLGELVGRSAQKTPSGVVVDAFKLLTALEIGDNPLPPLETRAQKPRLRVLVTPDCSGSTQNWNGLGRAWALFLAKLPDVDVVYHENMNGQFWHGMSPHPEAEKLLSEADVVVYLGDSDGESLCRSYAEKGATVLALDCHCASVAKPRLRYVSQKGSGSLYWVDRVSAKQPETWYQALKLVLGR